MAVKPRGLNSLLQHINEAPIVKFTPRSSEDMGEIVKGWLASDRAAAQKRAGGGIGSLKEDVTPNGNGIHPWEEKTPYVPIKRVLQQVEEPADPARFFKIEPDNQFRVPSDKMAKPKEVKPGKPMGHYEMVRHNPMGHFEVATQGAPRPQEPMGHYQMVPFAKKTATPPISATPNQGFGGMNSMLGGALIGGGVSYLGSTPENRNFGTFAKGAAFGAAGGAIVSAVGSRGMMSASSGYAHGVSKKLGFGEGFTENIVDAAKKMESADHRGVLFASGAMLAGGMFGTNRNRAQGLNSTRGNRFGG